MPRSKTCAIESRVERSEQQRFFENKIAPYQAMVQLSLAQNNHAEALIYAERAKGRVLLDVLNSGRDDVTKGMTTEEIKRDRTLNTDIALLNTLLARLKSQGTSGRGASDGGPSEAR